MIVISAKSNFWYQFGAIFYNCTLPLLHETLQLKFSKYDITFLRAFNCITRFMMYVHQTLL